MGYGGALIWTGLAKNLKRQFPETKIVFIFKPSIRNILKLSKNQDLLVYKNNTDIDLLINNIFWKILKPIYHRKDRIVVDLSNKIYQYWIKDYGDHITYRKDGHAIEIACKPFNIQNIELTTRLDLKEEEIVKAQKILVENNIKEGDYICIEPNSKKDFTLNKQWPLDKWVDLVISIQEFIKKSNFDYKIVQLGVRGSELMPGVVDLTGKTSFRELKYIISNAKLIITNEGGIAHLSTSTKTPSIVIFNPALPKGLMEYPQNINVRSKHGSHECGEKKRCEVCQNILSSIESKTILEEVKKVLS